MCGADNCGIDVRVDGDRIVDVRGMREFPVNRGRLCPQARAAVEMTYHPDRLKHPLRREGATWRRITWGEALDHIAGTLDDVRSQYGAGALAVYLGRALLQFIRDGWAQRFMNLYGTPNLVRNEHMCAVPNRVGEQLTYGTSAAYYSFDAEHANCILLWGSNPTTSHIPMMWPEMVRARRRGAKLIVIDPRRTRAAKGADLHAALRPGTDLALALALIHVIVEERLYDAEFVSRWTVGLDRLAEQVEPYTPEWATELTGVPAATIREIAVVYAQNSPAFLDAGNALEHHSNTGQTVRAVMILRALTGNLDVPGGHLFPARVPLADLTLTERRPADVRPLSAERYPLLWDLAHFVPGDVLVDALMAGTPYPVKAMIMAGGNPLLTWPNTTVMRQALEQLDLLVVMDLFMTPTARQADIVLPAADPFEGTQLVVRSGFFGPDRPTAYLALRKQIKSHAECRSDWRFWRDLAHRMGYGEDFDWQDEDEAIDALLEPTGVTVQDLRDQPAGMFYGDNVRYRKYEQHGLATPTGKVEFYSYRLEASGYDPLPAYREPDESPLRRLALAERFPLVLNAGRRVAVYTHSRHRNLTDLHQREPVPQAELHPETAAACGVADGDWIVVESPRGSVQVRAQVTSAVRPDIVSLLHGWEGANANLLTDHAHCDEITASPPLRAGLCRVRPATKSAGPGPERGV
jgi:anaerobic selenocysteine-containing dehydrogenase